MYTLEVVNTAVRGNGALDPTHSGTAGRLALMFVGAGSMGSVVITNPSGWTELSARSTHTKILGRILTGGDATPNVTFSDAGRHFAQIAEFSGDVYTDLGSIVHAEADAFGTVTVPSVPNLTISEADCLVIIAGSHNKTATSNGATYNDVSNFTEIAESRPSGTDIDFVWNYWSQTTATSLSGVSRAMTGTTESTTATGLSVALQSSDPVVTSNAKRALMLGVG